MKLLSEKWRTLLVGLMFVLAPFEYWPTVELAGYTLKISYLAGLVLIGWYAIANFSLRSKNIWRRFDPEEKVFLGLIVWGYATAFWSLDPKRTAIINSVILFLFIISAVVARVINSESRAPSSGSLALRLRRIIISTAALLALFGLWQFVGDTLNVPSNWTLLRTPYQHAIFGFPRVHATLLEPLYFANFLLAPIFFILILFLSCQSPKRAGLLFLLVLVFTLTLSRGAFGAFALGLVTLFLGIVLKLRQYLVPFARGFVLIGAAVVVALALIFWASGQKGVNAFVEQSVKGESVPNAEVLAFGQSNDFLTSRGYTARLGWETAKGRPFGIGVAAFGALPQFAPLRESGGWQIVNNLYLETLVETGVIGLTLLLIFLAIILWQTGRIFLQSRDSKESLAPLGNMAILIAILAQYLTFSTFYILYLWLNLAIIRAAYRPTKLEE